jgi:acyl carrier protein
MDTVEQVRRIAADVFGKPAGSVTAETTPENMEEWDSVHHLNLMLALEQEFGVTLEPEEMEKMTSIRGIASFFETRRG